MLVSRASEDCHHAVGSNFDFIGSFTASFSQLQVSPAEASDDLSAALSTAIRKVPGVVRAVEILAIASHLHQALLAEESILLGHLSELLSSFLAHEATIERSLAASA